MKILLVLARFDRHKWDSLTDQAWNIARLLTASGDVQCVIAAGRSEEESALEVVQNVSIRRFSPQRTKWKFWQKRRKTDPRTRDAYLPSLEIFLRKNRFDLVHVMTPGRICDMVAEIAAERNIPCLVTCRSSEFMPFDAAGAQSRYPVVPPVFHKMFSEYAAALRKVDRIFCTDNRLRRALAGVLGDRQLVYWQAGVDWEYFAKPSAVDFRKEYQLPANCMLLLSVGRLSDDKNQKILLEIISLLKRRGWNCKLLIIGAADDGEYQQQFENYICEHKLNNLVKVIPGLPPGDERFKAAFQASSLVLLPARYEVSAAAVLEAWAAGVPVVAAPAGSGGELISDKVNGRLVPVRDFHEWVSCCEELLDERNRSALEKMRSTARSEAKKYRWSERLRELSAIYEEVISLKKCNNNNQHNKQEYSL